MNAIRKRVKQKDTSNLIEMVENPNRFQEVFVEAAIEELLERNANIDTDDAVLYLKKRKEVAEMLEEERQSVKVPYNLLHENIKNAIRLLYIIVFIRFVFTIFFSRSEMTLNFVTIPYFIEIISLSGLGFVIIGLHRGVIGVRKIFLIGFVLTGLSSIILFIAEIKFREFFLTALLDLCFVGLKFYCLYLLYNKTTNGWYRAYVKSLKSDK